LLDLDEPQRRAALDPAQSFTVRAPAGSGKTELLIQRFLRLLAIVKKPEAIVAITFTRKAAGEMLDRILVALRDAKAETPVEKPHLKLTRELARQVLQRDQEMGWDLLEHPGRLRVQTIDSLCMSITGEMPWLARLGGMPRIEEDARRLYEEAAHQTLLESEPEYQQALTTLLRHLDNNSTHARDLIATMLAHRDQWLKLLKLDDEGARGALEEALADAVVRGLKAVDVPQPLRAEWVRVAREAAFNMSGHAAYAAIQNLTAWPDPVPAQLEIWRALAGVLLTGDDRWRKPRGLTVRCGFPPGNAAHKARGADLIAALQERDGLLEALGHLRELPPPSYSDSQWDVLRALLRTLKLAVAQLRMVFRAERVIDFMELGIAAREALGQIDNPTEVAYRMDSRIEHLLVDEFQDTSRAQFELLEKLTNGWQAGDGRTLFLVGDPMQSIYRFRQAEVGLFGEAQEKGIGGLPMSVLELRLNRRSRPAIVERVNALFTGSFPKTGDAASGAVKYTASLAAREDTDGVVTIDGFVEGEDQLEAARVIQRIRDAQREDPEGSIAILVRARSHLFAITEALKAAALQYSAVDIDPLAGRSIVRDLMALTRAMLDPVDRIAWLSVLRAPWCGFTLGDLEALVRDRLTTGIWDCLQDLPALTEDGQQRAARLRDVLAEAFAEQGRWPLRRWVERAWMRLGGPASLEGSEGALQDASAYFDLLETEQAGADVRDFERFRKRVADLFAQPENPVGPGLHMLTIHKAKGLEFDTVIVPGLGRRPKLEDKPLVLFHEWRVAGGFECLVAPIDETRAEPDELYRYLRRLDRRENDWERTRQLYVAATRAKKRLHLMGHVGNNGDPAKGSMLSDLWPALSAEEHARFLRNNADAASQPALQTAGVLRRLPESWRLPDLPAPVSWQSTTAPYAEPHEPTFEWVGEGLRHTGTVVHAFVQRMTSVDDPAPDGPAIRRALMHAGASPLDLEGAAQRVRQALARIRASRRGRWIFEPHEDSRSEYAVTGVIGGEVVRGLVDRTFIDNGVRWIIDFKTSEHQGGKLEEFLDEQQRRYRDQMERYARILAPLGNPVRLGLYFPLLDGWREWVPEQASTRPVQAKLFSF